MAIPKEGMAVWGRGTVFNCLFCKMNLLRIIQILRKVQEINRISCLWEMEDNQHGMKESQSKRSQGDLAGSLHSKCWGPGFDPWLED